jgi:predicted FMN-binding regulatory protein PaiB
VYIPSHFDQPDVAAIHQLIMAQWKVSQNRPAEDREGVVAGLLGQGTGDDAMTLAGYVENARR